MKLSNVTAAANLNNEINRLRRDIRVIEAANYLNVTGDGGIDALKPHDAPSLIGEAFHEVQQALVVLKQSQIRDLLTELRGLGVTEVDQ
jgi:hypothetical protein